MYGLISCIPSSLRKNESKEHIVQGTCFCSCCLLYSVLHPDGLQHVPQLSWERNNGRMNLQSKEEHFYLCTKSNLIFCKSRSRVQINITVVLSCTNFIGKNRYSQRAHFLPEIYHHTDRTLFGHI